MLTGSDTHIAKEFSTSYNCEILSKNLRCVPTYNKRKLVSPVARVATITNAHTFLFIVDDIPPTVMQVALESSDLPLDAHSQRSHKTY
jgi:hypothetical protein